MKKKRLNIPPIVGIMSVLLFFSVTFVKAQSCSSSTPISVQVNTSNTTCTAGGSANLNISGGTPPYIYSWTPNVSTTNTANNLSAGNYTVEITDAACHAIGPELVVNGDFSAGTAGFTSSYTLCTTPTPPDMSDALYAIGTNAQIYHTMFWGKDHTTGTGNFMIVNGSTVANVSVWEETITVTPNTNYVFSTWLSAMNTISPAKLQFSINGVTQGGIFSSPNSIYNWMQFCTSWNSGSSTTAVISIVNQSQVLYGNDFGLDDISFRACTPSTYTFTINPTPTPIAQINSTGTFCTTGNGSATVIASGGTPGYTYQWSNGQTTPTASGLTPGSYSVVVSDVNGCKDTATVTVGSTNIPPIAAFSISPACEGAAIPVTDNSTSTSNDPIINWSWTLPGSNQSTASGQNPTLIYTTPGTHTVSLVVTTNNGCKDTVTNTVVVYNNPQPNFSGGAVGCAPVCSQFRDSSICVDGTITSWNWNFPGGTPNSSTVKNPYICYNSPGNYGATLTVTSSFGCVGSKAISPLVNVYPYPKADFYVNESSEDIDNPIFYFNHAWSPDVTYYQWNFGDNTVVNTGNANPVHSYSATANGNDFYQYTVSLIVQNQFGCQDSVSQIVKITPDFVFYIPNSFTPNGDQLNENFYGKGRGIKEYKIMLFDRWGNLIWNCYKEGNTNSFDDGNSEGMPAACKWDGTYKGDVVQEDVYVWKVELTDIFDLKHQYAGHVSVVK